MSGDFVAQWVSFIWAALDGHHELDFYVSSLVWRLGASFCGDATNVTSWQLALVWQLPPVWLAPSVLRCYPSALCQCCCSHSSGLGWIREPNQKTAHCIFGWVWLLTFLNFPIAELNKCICWRWSGREGWQDQRLVVVNCFQNHALVEKATKGSVFKKCLSLTGYCVYF